jgi:magnesium chelatase subunit I
MILFPFTAIVGMEDAKKSLIYHAIDPRIGGTLFRGHRGCAKSTLVRSFAEVLRQVSTENAPFVEVPLGTTEDRLLGSVNAEALVEKRKWSGRIGLIEEAHGGVLYIDEINLLPDHLADYILDSAASGRYRMERDGITRSVESRYILVGTMNPDEGDLRPQLSDRFAHGVLIRDDFRHEQRIEIVKRRIAFDDDPEKFIAGFTPSMSELANRIALARRRITEVLVSDDQRMAVAANGRELKLEGLRAELAVVRTARCAAAFDDRCSVEECDLKEAWRLCLGHRRTDQSGAPKSPSSAPATRPPSFGNRSTETSSAPFAYAIFELGLWKSGRYQYRLGPANKPQGFCPTTRSDCLAGDAHVFNQQRLARKRWSNVSPASRAFTQEKLLVLPGCEPIHWHESVPRCRAQHTWRCAVAHKSWALSSGCPCCRRDPVGHPKCERGGFSERHRVAARSQWKEPHY